ncbi:YheC/YheD family protein [Paenibacillus gansuensis]|uniref:YheC/YheD family protein n=1 Tax=Paenibacillus gansuensis TaxID=306542 RepID=A0ABW5PKH6_9BACL
MNTGRNAVSSKMEKTRILLRDPELARHVPETYPLTSVRLKQMLDRTGMVYVKPDTGSLGIGVMKVEKQGSLYRYQRGLVTRSFRTFEGMNRSIQRYTSLRPYLVQRGIHVLTRKGRPFDFRVMIQKNPSGKWEATGIAGRVAHPGKAVTNGSQGGTIYGLEELIKTKPGAERAKRSMEKLAWLTAVQFGRAYPAMKELGLDVAVDRNGIPWILEVNTRPDPCPFTKLADQSSIRKIVSFGKAYGRQYCLKCTKAKKPPAKGRDAPAKGR